MRKTHFILTIFITTLFFSWHATIVHAQAPSHSFDQVVVLKNGEVLRGKITQDAQQVIVETVHGSRLVLQRDQTDFICESLEEAYWGKCARTQASNTPGQISLFRWCLKYQLIEQAQNQLDLLMLTDIKSTQLNYLGRQLGVAIRQKQTNAASAVSNVQHQDSHATPIQAMATLAGASRPVTIDPSIGTLKLGQSDVDISVFRPLPSLSIEGTIGPSEIATLPTEEPGFPNQSMVRQVGFQEDISYDTISRTHRMPSVPLSVPTTEPATIAMPHDDRMMIPIEELESEMKALPKGTVSGFRRKVEHVLINGCNAARCHDSDLAIMPLIKISRSQRNPVRFSQRNLHNVLKYIDRQSPEDSRVFLAATQLHAGLDKPIFDEKSRQYENLTRWLISVSDDPNREFSRDRNGMEEPPLSQPDQSAQPLTAKPLLGEPLKANSGLNGSLDHSPASLPPASIPSTIGEIPKLERNQSGYAPRDPFDPEVFNRQSRRN